MSDVPAHPGFARQLAGRWQVPLLLVSLAALGGGIWRLRPAPKPPEFEPLFAHAVSLHHNELYPEATNYIATLLNAPERNDEQKRRLYGLLTKVTFDRERRNVVHTAAVATQIIGYADRSLAPGESFDAPTLHMRGLASEWLRKPWQAVSEYKAEIAKGVADPWALRRRILDIRVSSGDIDDDELRSECEAFVKGDGVSDAMAYWAAERVVDLLAREKKHVEAEKFLAEQADRFRKSTEKGAYDYLQALMWFHLGKRAEAERLLRAIRDDLPPVDPTAARAGLLLGRILLDQDAPEYALAFFDDVIRNTQPGQYRWVAVLGRADALYALQRYDEAMVAYNDAARQVSESPYESVIETGPVGEVAPGSVEGLAARWRSPTAAAYLRIFTRRADLGFQLGKEALARAEQSETKVPPATQPGIPEVGRGARHPEEREQDQAERDRAKEYLARAGEHYLGLASLVILEESGAIAAMLRAADAFDLADDHARVAEVLEKFIRKYPDDTIIPEALLRLGQAYQSLEQYDQAIARYQDDLIRFPRTPAAIGSLVPLAECFVAVDQPDKAEQTLLRLLEHSPSDPLGLITPTAVHYCDALFALADLYMGQGRYEKAITRYEEAIERYQKDPRVNRATFMLAEAYRHSARGIRKDYAESQSLPYAAELSKAHRSRLARARQLYASLADRYGKRPAESLSEMERLQLRLSSLYAADSVFEVSQLPDAPTSQPAAEALELYEQAARTCGQDPIAMSAYVQIINCNLNLGRVEKARMALQRARWTLRNIPDSAFENANVQAGRAFWDEYLTWLEKTPTLTATRPAEG